MNIEEERYSKIFNSLDYKSDMYIDILVSKIKEIMLKRIMFINNSSNDDKTDEFFIILKDTLLKIYKKNEPIKFIGMGHTSLVFKIDEKVIKIGKTNMDMSKYRKNLPCLIPLLLDTYYKIDERKYYNLQITPYVENKMLNYEDVYILYKKLREYGYIWNDPTINNIGIIKEDIFINDIYYKKGNLVILDLEDIAYVGKDISDIVLEEIAISSYNKDVYNFEMRYINELKNKVL